MRSLIGCIVTTAKVLVQHLCEDLNQPQPVGRLSRSYAGTNIDNDSAKIKDKEKQTTETQRDIDI